MPREVDANIDDAAQRLIARWARVPRRAVIFDFNGTLSNDEPLLLRIYTEMFRERLGWDLTPEDYYSRLAGRSDREIIDAVVADVGGDETTATRLLAERRDRYGAMVKRQSPVLCPTARTVSDLAAAGVPLGIVTGAQRADVELVLSSSPLAGLFQVVVTEEDVLNGKPDPEGFRLASRLLGSDQGATLVFEDSLPGVQAAKAAGMLCVGVEGTLSRAQIMAEADASVAAIVPELFASLCQSENDANQI
jgi:HAD superfamily hydrolase (TIGR01509 family)